MVKVNKLSSTKTQLPYSYYTLPYCQPDKIIDSAENLIANHRSVEEIAQMIGADSLGFLTDWSLLGPGPKRFWDVSTVSVTSLPFLWAIWDTRDKARNHGHVVTIASAGSFLGVGEIVDYTGSKASALAFHEGLTQEIRQWYKAPKVRTRYVSPLFFHYLDTIY